MCVICHFSLVAQTQGCACTQMGFVWACVCRHFPTWVSLHGRSGPAAGPCCAASGATGTLQQGTQKDIRELGQGVLPTLAAWASKGHESTMKPVLTSPTWGLHSSPAHDQGAPFQHSSGPLLPVPGDAAGLSMLSWALPMGWGWVPSLACPMIAGLWLTLVTLTRPDPDCELQIDVPACLQTCLITTSLPDDLDSAEPGPDLQACPAHLSGLWEPLWAWAGAGERRWRYSKRQKFQLLGQRQPSCSPFCTVLPYRISGWTKIQGMQLVEDHSRGTESNRLS